MSSLRQPYAGLLYYSLVMAFSLSLQAQTITPQGGEFGLLETGFLRGDQTSAHLSLTPNGGYVVWQDNSIDGAGAGIGARWIDSSFSPSVFGSFRVNQQGNGQQHNPQVATFPNGAAAVVWQGGVKDRDSIYVRFLSPNRTFMTSDVRINTYTNQSQRTPTVAIVSNGVIAVVWARQSLDASMQDIFMRLVKTNGQLLASSVQVNQFTNYNQRHPAMAVLGNGNFVVVWVSEQQRLANTSDIMARIFNSAGQPLSTEFRVNTNDGLCGAPAVSPSGGGGFNVVWSQRSIYDTDGWDIYSRSFNADGSTSLSPLRVNTYITGDQFAPRISAVGTEHLIVWTSLGEDGSYDGIFGRLLHEGIPASDPFLVNTTTLGKQFGPTVSSDGTNRFLVAWTGYVGLSSGFDLFAQRYAAGAPLPTPDAPFASALNSTKVSVSWPALAGYPLSCYEVFVDDGVSPTALVTNGNYWVATGLSPGSSHTFRLAYRFSGGIRSSLSAATPASTWGEDAAGPDGVPDGVPDDWQVQYWGAKSDDWARASADSDGDGASNAQEFLAGTNPLDANSVLRTWFTWNRFGRRLNWNTQAGLVYQVQKSTQLGAWSSLGSPRFAAGNSDSLAVAGDQVTEFFRVVRLR